ncbi:hypothetical protein [Vitreimonas sp.]|jgi:hypothetical protein|uniref:hypothetical protein n=1 Tax=Vitreimonas sp. TaxID=3069702 RepID=UPI002ED7D9F9
MPRNLVLYGLAALAGLVLYGVLRALLGFEIVMLLSLIVLGVVGVIVYRNLQTNRKIADATPAERSTALAFTPEPGKAALYILRNQFVGRAVGVNIEVDGKQITQLKSPRFMRLTLNPGPHRIVAYMGTPDKKKPGEAVLEGNAQPGEVLILKTEIEPQMVGVTVKLTPVELDRIRADFQKTRMVANDVAEV